MLQSPTPYTAITLTVKGQTPSIAGQALIEGSGVKFLFSERPVRETMTCSGQVKGYEVAFQNRVG